MNRCADEGVRCRGGALVAGLFTAAVAGLWSERAEAVTPECDTMGCGSNTPVLYGTPIIGLSLDGGVNAHGVELDPQLVRVQERPTWRVGPDCPVGAVLGVDHGELVGKVGASIQCRRDQLLGLAFQLKVPCDKRYYKGGCPAGKVAVQIRISEAGQVATWRLDAPRPVPSYRLTWTSLSPAAPPDEQRDDSLCPRREAWMEREQLWALNHHRLSADRQLRYERWKRATDHLLVVQGEAYLPDASVDAARLGPGWFNLACAGSAIAKMRLIGYDPIAAATPAGRQERQATLKMLTARYRGAIAYTSPGVPLMYRHRSNLPLEGQPHPASWSVHAVESGWGASGALCLSHRRTWRQKALLGGASPWPESGGDPEAYSDLTYAALEAWFVELFLGAPPLPACTSALMSAAVWVTYPIDHVSHP